MNGDFTVKINIRLAKSHILIVFYVGDFFNIRLFLFGGNLRWHDWLMDFYTLNVI